MLHHKKTRDIVLWLVLIAGMLAIVSAIIPFVTALPSAVDSYANTSQSAPEPSAGAMINATGGKIVTINFNATTQNYRWKGFVGNVSGKFSLMDSSSYTLYDWDLATVQGEIYATRYSGMVDWDSVRCPTDQEIATEENGLGFSFSDIDSINNTFNDSTHNSFYAGNTFINANACPSVSLYSGGAKTNDFQELLLFNNKLIFTGLLRNSVTGFNNQKYDYELIVPDTATPTGVGQPYYFYIELI